MSVAKDEKEQHLRKQGALYAGAGAVVDPLFDQSEFFDPRDLVLVKYEMLRRVRTDGISVVEAAKRFGFSRAGFYKTLSAFQRLGLVGLMPARPGPRQAHKLTDDILGFIDEQALARGPLPATELAALVLQNRDVSVHPRSIERALARRKKKGR
jgi:transposase